MSTPRDGKARTGAFRLFAENGSRLASLLCGQGRRKRKTRRQGNPQETFRSPAKRFMRTSPGKQTLGVYPLLQDENLLVPRGRFRQEDLAGRCRRLFLPPAGSWKCPPHWNARAQEMAGTSGSSSSGPVACGNCSQAGFVDSDNAPWSGALS